MGTSTFKLGKHNSIRLVRRPSLCNRFALYYIVPYLFNELHLCVTGAAKYAVFQGSVQEKEIHYKIQINIAAIIFDLCLV